MDGASYGSSGKRSYQGSEGNVTDRQNKRTISTGDQQSTSNTDDMAEFRILCPGAKIGSIIGKGGNIIKAMRQESCSKIKIEDPVPNSDERVIYIASSREPRVNREGGFPEKYLCAAQEALFKVHVRIVEGDGPEDEPPLQVTVRLLVPKAQIGSLIGKGGRVIEQMRKEIPCQIRVLPKNQLPACATEEDELVQVTGNPGLVKRALYAISSRVLDSFSREKNQGPSGPGFLPPQESTFGGAAANNLYTPGNYLSSQAGSLLLSPSMMGLGQPYSMYGGGMSGRMVGGGVRPLSSNFSTLPQETGPERTPEENMVVRFLCPNDKVGSMIGKGGNVIRKIREETGAKIKVCDPVPDADERVLEISSTEGMDSHRSSVIEAALQAQKRLAELTTEKDGNVNAPVVTRLLVPSTNIGCLLGKGGSVISEMRKTTRANIRIPPKDERPKIAGEGDELVQVSGELSVSQAGLLQVLNKLRANLFKGHHEGVVHEIYPSFLGMPYATNGPILPTYGSSYGGLGSTGMFPMSSNPGYSAPPLSTGYGNYGLLGSGGVKDSHWNLR